MIFCIVQREHRGSLRAVQLGHVVIKCVACEMTRGSPVSGDEDETRGQWIIRELIRQIENA